jgi:hypothetical protein
MTSLRARATIVPFLLGAAGIVGAAPASAAVDIRTDPGLRPRFDAGVPDYVSRCEPGRPLRFTVSATNGDTVAIGHGTKRTGDFTADADVATGASVSVRVAASGRRSTHHVRCLPEDFPVWTVHRHRRPESQWYVLTPVGKHDFGYVAVFDARGVPVWWMHSSWYAPWDGKLLRSGNLAWSRIFSTDFGLSDDGAWEEHALDGRTVRVLKTKGTPTDFHDLTETPGGNYLLDSYRRRPGTVDLRAYGGPPDATVYDAEIQELTPEGQLVWKWSSKTRIDLSENTWWTSHPPKEGRYDAVHINSMEPDGDGIVVSARFLDAVFRIDRRTKRITWKLGGTRRPESLDVRGDPFGKDPLHGQHDARLLADHTLTAYDNGASNYRLKKRPPRTVRYRIDTKHRTATLLEDLRDKAVPSSGWGGSARKLPKGNWVVNWGGTRLMTERTEANRPVIEIEFGGDRYGYRAFPIPRDRVTAQELRRGMDAMLTAGAGEVPAPRR